MAALRTRPCSSAGKRHKIQYIADAYSEPSNWRASAVNGPIRRDRMVSALSAGGNFLDGFEADGDGQIRRGPFKRSGGCGPFVEGAARQGAGCRWQRLEAKAHASRPRVGAPFSPQGFAAVFKAASLRPAGLGFSSIQGARPGTARGRRGPPARDRVSADRKRGCHRQARSAGGWPRCL